MISLAAVEKKELTPIGSYDNDFHRCRTTIKKFPLKLSGKCKAKSNSHPVEVIHLAIRNSNFYVEGSIWFSKSFGASSPRKQGMLLPLRGS